MALVEEDGSAGFDDRAPERDGEMRFAHARRAEDEDVFGLAEEARRRQLAHEALIDGGLECEVEIVERLHRRKVRDLQAHGDPRPLLRVDLLSQDAVEEIEIGRLGAGGVIEHGVEALGDVPEPQACELLDHAGVNDDAHWPPSTTAA